MLFRGQFVNGIDLVDVILWAFVIFFIALIWYLQRESAREGYPLEDDTSGRREPDSMFFFPPKKEFRLPHGRGTIEASHIGPADTREHALRRAAPWDGSPNEPTGDGMGDGVGPGSYAMRADVPDLTDDGRDRITPFRLNPDYTVPKQDLDPRGLDVIGADGHHAGKVVDLWVDRSEAIIRYLEVEVTGFKAKGTVLLPVPFANVSKARRRVEVTAVNTEHFANVPRTKSPDRVTRLEEDMIAGYYGGGTLFADPKRREPWI